MSFSSLSDHLEEGGHHSQGQQLRFFFDLYIHVHMNIAQSKKENHLLHRHENQSLITNLGKMLGMVQPQQWFVRRQRQAALWKALCSASLTYVVSSRL